MQSAKMQSAKCKVQNAKCKNAKCQMHIECMHTSQEVVRRWLLGGLGPLRRRGVPKGDVLLVQVLVEFQNGGDVAASVAVVGRTPHRHKSVVEHLLVPIHHQLVGTGDLREVVGVVELLHVVRAEQKARATGRHVPAVDLLGIRPPENQNGKKVGEIQGNRKVERLAPTSLRRAFSSASLPPAFVPF